MQPRIAITPGDAAGIGPEIAMQAALSPAARRVCRPLLVGPAEVVRDALKLADPGGQALLRVLREADDVDEEFPGVQVLDTGSLKVGGWTVGRLSADCGRSAAEDTACAVRLALRGAVHGLVSGPVNKQAFRLAGHDHPGQTEFLQALTGARAALTILVGGPMRVALLSSHVSLQQAIELTTRPRIVSVVRELYRALREAFALDDPAIGLAGLNPHAGDGGLMGREEIDEVLPAMRELQQAGLRVTGPVPADAFFLQGEQGRYDGMLALYHDQGVVPLKRHAYATYAYGLPIIRTTPGHGTAYDIAGRGAANASAMLNAVSLAAFLARVRARRQA